MDPFDDELGPLPADDDTSRLRVMVCDPGTIHVYWQAGAWRGDGWRVLVFDKSGAVTSETALPAEERTHWAHPAPDTHGEVHLQSRQDERFVTVAKVAFHTPTDRARAAAIEPTFARMEGRADSFVPQDNPELEDVVMYARTYHGKVWSPAEEGDET
jgi:hypothetical protein